MVRKLALCKCNQPLGMVQVEEQEANDSYTEYSGDEGEQSENPLEAPRDEHLEWLGDSTPVPLHVETVVEVGSTMSQDIVDLHVGEDNIE